MQSLIKFLQIQKGILQYDHFSSSKKKCKILTDSQVKLDSKRKNKNFINIPQNSYNISSAPEGNSTK